MNFRAAAEEMALTQSAVSRQIQALESEVGVSLFLRHTRAVKLTSAGRKSVSLTIFASFASMWLIPRLDAFQRE